MSEIRKGIAADWKPLPIYRQIANHLRDRILAGDFPPGSRLPTHDELIVEYGKSMATIRLALDVLKHEGWISAVQGLGMFVADPLPKQPAV